VSYAESAKYSKYHQKTVAEMTSPDRTTSTRVPSTMSLADVTSRKTFWSNASWRNNKILSRRL